MDPKNALTISFTVDKDNLMENQLRIPMKYLSRECAKLDGKVSWTTFAGCKTRRCSSQLKNGRKPHLVLTDVLKTDLGKAYVEKMKLRQTKGNRGGVRKAQRESGRCQEETLSCRERRSARRDVRRDNNESITPKCNQKITPHTPQRHMGTSQTFGKDEEKEVEENDDTPEVIVGEDNGEDYTYTEIVDCGLSVTWKPTEDTTEDKLSPSNTKDGWMDPPCRLQNSLKKRKGDHKLHCNGTGSTRGLRRSVLRLSEVGKDGAPARKHICVEEGGNVGGLYSADNGIIEFTVGEDDDSRGILIPVTRSHMETGETIETLSSSQDGKSKTSPSEPIVLSSDDDEDNSGGIPQLSRLRSVATVKDVLMQKQPISHAVNTQHGGADIQDVEVLHMVEDTPTPLESNFGNAVAYPCMGVAFSTLRCGRYQGKANGDVMIVEQRIIIPVKDTKEQVMVTLTLERKEVKRFSIWEKEEMESRSFHYYNKDEPPPPAVLMLNVSETAAAAIHWDLRQLPVRKSDACFYSASPFLLLSLKDPMRGIAGAVLRSLLEMDFFSSLAHPATGQGVVSRLEDLETPVISLDDSVELIRKTGLDPLLLSLLSGDGVNSGAYTELDGILSDTEEKNTTQNELALELEVEPDTGLNPTEDQEEQKAEVPAEESREEPTPVYMVCHRRIKGNYSVTLSKPDSRWTQYKYQGHTSRLIQFPPPPLKGGITVTMEDLQCLDNGHFLNDVIIDFYLKYLLQNAPAAMVERCHIFSSFFYKQLTRRDNASEGSPSETCQRQRRHQRVKTWTRHIDIFKKDFVFMPVNQEAHWYLVVICFPGLNEPCLQAWAGLDSQIGNSQEDFQEENDTKTPKSLDNPEGSPPPDHKERVDTTAENAEDDSTKEAGTDLVNCTEQTCQMKYVCKRPCILVMDSLKISSHERVFKLLREYLQSEWEVRRGSSRLFSPEQMKGSQCKVPTQDNSSDCGLYLLHYVETFLKDPVVHFDLPLRLESWFPRQQIRRKRDEIRNLVLNLYRKQNLDNVR
ncbi:sentrin-specific protease 7 isoform X2 [Thalassophryne amazonica]|uniref:sentrin-specific protease 7 isoform X2 n=1 Tax=Thalassophryne amazonica TaxID=390379 RepID=UPI001470F973|nr:sentrin-specific protease 7 isoform X2 [Thalassophryne amazonica]